MAIDNLSGRKGKHDTKIKRGINIHYETGRKASKQKSEFLRKGSEHSVSTAGSGIRVPRVRVTLSVGLTAAQGNKSSQTLSGT